MEHLRDGAVTHLSGNPAFYRWLADPRAGDIGPPPPGLRAMGTGGAALTPSLRETCLQRWGIHLRDTLGTTEACILAGEEEGRPGLSLAWQELRLSGPEGNRLETRGPSLLWGTWKPGIGMVERSGPEWEPTGDLARWHEDGSLVLLGRDGAWFKDSTSQKVGFAEVENALWESGFVIDCAVVQVQPEGGLALAVPTAGATQSDIASALAARLGRGRLPAIRLVDRIERTPHGKLARHAIADLESQPDG
jgi:acetyl-CoA synthetase